MVVYATTSLAYSKQPYISFEVNIYHICFYNIILLKSFILFSVILWLVTITVTMSSDVIGVWQYDCDVTLILTLSSLGKKINQKKERELKNKKASI